MMRNTRAQNLLRGSQTVWQIHGGRTRDCGTGSRSFKVCLEMERSYIGRLERYLGRRKRKGIRHILLP